MKNPWKALRSEPPFVLESDASAIQAHADWLQSYRDRRIRLKRDASSLERIALNTSLVPIPRMGPVNAPVVVLQLNPSFDRTVTEGADVRANLLASAREENSPHVDIADPESGWWNAATAQLRREFTREFLSRQICAIEFYPYRSISNPGKFAATPSQDYGFQLARRAVREGRLVLITRSFGLWSSQVPELSESLGRNVFMSRNPQIVRFSKGCFPTGYPVLLEKLEELSKPGDVMP